MITFTSSVGFRGRRAVIPLYPLKSRSNSRLQDLIKGAG